MKIPTLRRVLPWFIVAIIAGAAIYGMKSAPVAVAAHTIAKGAMVGEVMGTGTLL